MPGILLAAVLPAWTQSPLSLPDAVRLALDHHPAIEASVAAKQAAQSRVDEARSGFLPAADYSESYQRSNNPVFVFGSLLDQHQFKVQNFELDKLNYPYSLNSFQSMLRVGQTLYDGGVTKARVRSAELGAEIAAEDERRTRMRTIAGAVASYFGAVLGDAHLQLAEEAVHSAETDLKQAENVRSAGMSTDADVLSVQVHLAAMKERRIQARYALDTALAALNDALGLGLETHHELSTPLAAATLHNAAPEDVDQTATRERPEVRQAGLSIGVAEAQSRAARAALFPRISAQGALEADRGNFVTRGGANWTLGLSLNWNLFNGFADRSRREETAQLAAAARARQKRTASAVRLEVRRADADWRSAQERIGVAAAAVSMAEESRRITRNRYEAGLTTIAELLRNETALLEAKTRSLEAVYEQRVALSALELAKGTLTGDSDAVQ